MAFPHGGEFPLTVREEAGIGSVNSCDFGLADEQRASLFRNDGMLEGWGDTAPHLSDDPRFSATFHHSNTPTFLRTIAN
jgi:hypothetical protein